MKNAKVIVTLATVLGLSTAGVVYATGTKDETDSSMASEIQLLQTAKISLSKAGEIALGKAPGKLAAIGFNDENGKGVYEVTIVGADNAATLVKVDGTTGAVLASGLVASMEDEHHHDQNKAEDSENETD